MGFSAGAAAIGGSTIGGLLNSNATTQASKKASDFDTQAYDQDIASGNQANAQDQAIYNTEAGNLNPLIQTGSNAANQLNSQLPSLTAQFTGANLASTPGYQFTLNQGLEQAQSGFAAQGLASSGAAIKGAENYATGLAQSTYNQQLQNYLTQNNQIYSMLSGTAQAGANAASNLGNSAAGVAGGNALVQAALGGTDALTSAGTAAAAGITGSTAQALSPLTTLSNLGGAYAGNALLASQLSNLGGLGTSNVYGTGANQLNTQGVSGNSVYGTSSTTPMTNAQMYASP
jgi:hypothetical protein